MELEQFFVSISDFFGFIAKKAERGITSLFGSSNERQLKKYEARVEAINKLEGKYREMSDDELKEQTVLFRQRLFDGETLDDILEEAFAVCREASRRVLGLRHYDVQLIGGMVLHSGAIAEMMTGEGKTLVATLPAYLNALEGKGVHVVTVNDYLARRDMEWMGPLYMSLGLTVGNIQANMSTRDRQAAYSCDITYGTNNEFGFDYLRDNMRPARRGDSSFDQERQQSQGPLHYAIVDEVDNILIDEARTPLIISGPSEDDVTKYGKADAVARQLVKDEDFTVDEKDHTCNLTDIGIRHAERLAGVESFYTAGNMHWPHLIDNALKAHHLYKLNVNYVIRDGEIIIVDEFTGRLMEGRNWSDGLHQAVEAKEGVRVKKENQTLATITLQNFFKMYDKLSGMTGTASTEAVEFWKIYHLDVITIPPNRPVQRKSFPDKIYKTEREKYEAVVEEIEKVHKWDVLTLNNDNEYWGTVESETDSEVLFRPKGAKEAQSIAKSGIKSLQRKGCPILVGTTSIAKSELISKMLDRKGIKHQVLNAKPENVGREAEIIAQAGRLGAVTIATNMAGRGTDIILGGNPETLAWSIFQHKYPTRLDVPREEWNAKIQEIETTERMKEEGDEVRRLGGLHIIGTERHEARRIDLQLRGRSGRQGDPGQAQFFLSLEDELVRVFAGDWVKNILTRLGMEDGQAIENAMVSRRIEGAQKKVEERNFEIRKGLLDYDEVMDVQRKRVYSYRQRILDNGNTRDFVGEMIDYVVKKRVKEYLDPNFGPMAFADYASKDDQFGVEFEPRQFRSMSFREAEDCARDYARRMAETQVLDAIDENLSYDVPEEEWNWQALAAFANQKWKAALRDGDLRKVGRDDVAQFLIKKSSDYIDRVDISRVASVLEPNYGAQSVSVFAKIMFGLKIDPASFKGLEPEQIYEKVRAQVLDLYREKEVQFPVVSGLIHYTIRDESGRRLNREGIIEWAKRRFGIDLPGDELKNMQRRQIEEDLFGISRKSLAGQSADVEELDRRLKKIFENQKVNIDKITAAREEKIRRNEKITLEDRIALKKKDPDLADLCRWIDERFGANVTPAEICDWDVLFVRNRLESLIEEKYNPEIRRAERHIILSFLDGAWKEHLLTMDRIKAGVGFRGYAQSDPKVEYKREGMAAFEKMWTAIFENVLHTLFQTENLNERFLESVWVESEATHESYAPPAATQASGGGDIGAQQDAAIEASKASRPQTIRNKTERVGPNEPCPCGSGKKYKKCCGRKK